MKDVLLSVAPIAWLVVALSVLKLKAWQATATALAVAVAIALVFFRAALPPSSIPSVAAEGVAFALCPICLVVLAALFTYAVTVESGAMENIRRGLTEVSDDRRVLALLVVWGFGNFMEGMAGFGTAVAIPAAILVGIGFDPVKAVVMCLVANTTPTAFGSVGVPLMTLAKESGVDVDTLSWATALLQCAVTAAGPVLVLLVLDGRRALKGAWRAIVIADVAFLVPWLLASRYSGCELPDIVGGLGVMVALWLAFKGGGFSGFGGQLRAWAPFGLVVVVLGVNSVMPPSVKAWTTPGALILVAGFVGGLAQHVSPRRLVAVLFETLVRYWAAFATICFVLAMARIMGSAGMISAMASALVSATGDAYPFAATAVGALGGFVTGSGTSSCVLFGRLQADAAAAISASPVVLAAANVMGAGIGKMICPQSIAIGAAAAGLVGAESRLFKAALPWFAGVVAAASVIAGLAAHAFSPASLLVLHLDFNTIQMKETSVVECLRQAADMGYNAVLWEIENKVQWETCPECVDPEAFSKEEFRRILSEADRLGLEPIPLMQTFGHAEYVLRHDKYAGWKESPSNLACYCVSRPEVLAFQKALLREYLDLFGSRVRRFHLGGDEALAFGTCPLCRKFDKMDLYVRHLSAVSEELIEKGIRPGVWADMVLMGGDWRNHGKACADDDAILKLPRCFTLWNWDYNYGVGSRQGRIAATPRLAKLGYEVILSAASQSAMDSPFLPKFKPHRDNIAACAADVRAMDLAGLCVTSWSVHLYPKSLQYPLWEFAAKRLKDPSESAEADFASIARKRLGDVPVDVLDRLSAWRWEYSTFDTRIWRYEKPAKPATAGLLAERLAKLDTEGGRRRMLENAREDLRAIDVVRKELGANPQSSAELRQLDAAGALTSTFLDQVTAVLENRRADKAALAMKDAARYYSTFQTPRSAENSARLVWSVLEQGE